MTSALIGLALILLIAVAAVALGALSRLLAARIVGRPRHRDARDAPLTPLDRIALGNSLIARDLQPDSTRPMARTRAEDGRMGVAENPEHGPELAQRYFFAATHALR